MFRKTKRKVSNRKNFEPSESGYILHAEEAAVYDSYYNNTKLSWYSSQPLGEITIEEFETWSIDRLKVLIEIESAMLRNKSYKDLESLLKGKLQQLLPLSNKDPATVLRERKKDYYSHFVLRLCFCSNKQLQERFVKCETMLFKLRYQMLTSQEQMQFIRSLNLPWTYITAEEKAQFETELYAAVAPQLGFQLNIMDEPSRQSYFKSESFIKIPFESAIDLVSQRAVYVNKGFAYVASFQQLNLLSIEYQKMLTSELARCLASIATLGEDDRLLPILNNLASGFNSNFDEFETPVNSEINAQTVMSLTKHYPLCARELLTGLQTDHHLKYQGRQQLSFFLKGIGLDVEEALKFFAIAFSAGMTEDKFNKEYRYNFRHNYGLEGARINYRPWDCRTILSKPRPGKSEHHGCPYRDYSKDKLAASLQAMKLESNDLNDVLDSCERGEYTVACTKVFEVTHGVKGGEASSHISHPNLYFDRSRQLEKKAENA